jgi:hypothetical protein
MLEETKNVVYDTKYVSEATPQVANPADTSSMPKKKSGLDFSFLDKIF